MSVLAWEPFKYVKKDQETWLCLTQIPIPLLPLQGLIPGATNPFSGKQTSSGQKSDQLE